MTITMPENVKYIIGLLNKAGYEAYAVGGCVRDSLIGRVPNDWDITTSAFPERIKEIFGRTVDTGIEHGTVTVMLGKEGYEVTTYRVDGKYSDSRHPDSVSFTRSLAEDLKRRDFTINAMAYNDTEGLVDLFGGTADLENRVIRCVGNPSERFGEDALRILRAVRFASQLDFKIDEETERAAKKLAKTIEKISVERIHAELEKLFMSKRPDMINKLHELNIDRYVLPELAGIYNDEKNCGRGRTKELEERLCAAASVKNIRWAILLYYTGSETPVMRRLRFDNNTLHSVQLLIRYADYDFAGIDHVKMRFCMYDAGKENIPGILGFVKALHPQSRLDKAYRIYEEILERGDATSMKELCINGKILMERFELSKGKQIGELLNKLMQAVIEKPELNSTERLCELAQNIVSVASEAGN